MYDIISTSPLGDVSLLFNHFQSQLETGLGLCLTKYIPLLIVPLKNFPLAPCLRKCFLIVSSEIIHSQTLPQMLHSEFI
jgi:hypothetical protein